MWGFSPPLDFQEEIESDSSELEFLIVGQTDARHIIKTVSSSYKHSKKILKFHIVESTLEQVCRSILFLSICLEKDLGLQEATRYYLEIYGNTLLRPATAKFLAQRVRKLADIPSKSMECPWLNLECLKHREKDRIEAIFKFWERAVCEGVPISEYWNRRVRKSLETRYDFREGAYDWDFHMVLKPRNAPNLTQQEYRFWRENGIAYTWIEGEPARSNPTLISNIVPEGGGFIHYAYLGDIKSGPFFTWALNMDYKSSRLRSTDVAEREVMRAIYETRKCEPICEKMFGAHRDSSLLNGIIVTEMPSMEIEQESWTGDKFRKEKVQLDWVDVPEIEIIFHSITHLENYKHKDKYREKFSLIFLSHNMTKQIPNLVPLLKNNSPFLVESRKFLLELRKQDLEKFSSDLKNLAKENGLRSCNDFDCEKHILARFFKD